MKEEEFVEVKFIGEIRCGMGKQNKSFRKIVEEHNE